MPKVAFVNKMDRMGADFFQVVGQIRERFRTMPLVLQIPVGTESGFRGVVDLVHMKQITWQEDTQGAEYQQEEIEPQLKNEASEAREDLVAKLAEWDDVLMEKYLEGMEILPSELIPVIRRKTLELKAVPVLCGSALKNKGIQPLLDAVVDFLPSPLDVPPIKGTNPLTEEQETRQSSEKEPLSALAFKIQMDQGRKLTFARIYSGRLQVGTEILNVTKGTKEKVSRIFQMHANKRERLEESAAGNIVALMGLKTAATGDTLCAPSQPIILEPVGSYEPVISIAVEAKTRGDQEKLFDSLSKLTEEDPTFRYQENEDTGQIVISGMGELHLEIVLKRLERDYNLGVNAGKPQVVYRETITQPSQAEGVFDRDIAGTRHYAMVQLHVAPRERGSGNVIQNKVRDESVPQAFIPHVEEGIGDALSSGSIMGYPVVDVESVIFGGKFQEGLSSEIAFRVAASMAFKKACELAGPVLLEPYMAVEILVPEEFLGDVLGDINLRKGKVENIAPRKAIQVLKAVVPLSRMFGYSTSLRSSTQGRATFTMHFSHYDLASGA